MQCFECLCVHPRLEFDGRNLVSPGYVAPGQFLVLCCRATVSGGIPPGFVWGHVIIGHKNKPKLDLKPVSFPDWSYTHKQVTMF